MHIHLPHRNIFTILVQWISIEVVWCVMLLNRWARKELRRGDLGTLAELANGRGWGAPNPDRIERLWSRLR
jgi:hypothetical protein